MSTNTDKLARMGIVHSAPTSGNDEVELLANWLHDHAIDLRNDGTWAERAMIRCEEAAALLRKLDAERSSFHMDYRMRHDVSMKALHVQIEELCTERAEILRISGLVWPPSAAIAKEGKPTPAANSEAVARPGTE